MHLKINEYQQPNTEICTNEVKIIENSVVAILYLLNFYISI